MVWILSQTCPAMIQTFLSPNSNSKLTSGFTLKSYFPTTPPPWESFNKATYSYIYKTKCTMYKSMLGSIETYLGSDLELKLIPWQPKLSEIRYLISTLNIYILINGKFNSFRSKLYVYFQVQYISISHFNFRYLISDFQFLISNFAFKSFNFCWINLRI